MAVRATELRKGSVVQKDGNLFVVTDYHHHTPGNLRAIIQMKLRNLSSGQVTNVRAGSSETFETAFLDKRKCEYLYREPSGQYIFMDTDSFEQFPLPADLVAESMGYVKENTTVDVTFHETKPIGIDLPASVEFVITESEAAVKGNTAGNVKKDAVVETGLSVKVPMHIGVGDTIRINTETGEFLGRVNA